MMAAIVAGAAMTAAWMIGPDLIGIAGAMVQAAVNGQTRAAQSARAKTYR